MQYENIIALFHEAPHFPLIMLRGNGNFTANLQNNASEQNKQVLLKMCSFGSKQAQQGGSERQPEGGNMHAGLVGWSPANDCSVVNSSTGFRWFRTTADYIHKRPATPTKYV